MKIGSVYNYYTILGPASPYISPKGVKIQRLLCECVCGTQKPIIINMLLKNRIKSCGCMKKMLIGKKNTKHGYRYTPIRDMYRNMLARCHDKKHKQYPDYGARGIHVCKEWRQGGLKIFGDWVTSNGWKKGLELDRKNNNKGYSPGNCQFVTKQVNINNRRNTIKVEYKNKEYAFQDFFRKYGKSHIVTSKRAYERIREGINPYTAVTSQDLRKSKTKKRLVTFKRKATA